MNIERTTLSTITLSGSIVELDTVESFLRHKLVIKLGDQTETDQRVADLNDQIALLHERLDTVSDPSSELAKDFRGQIQDLQAVIRVERRKADKPILKVLP